MSALDSQFLRTYFVSRCHPELQRPLFYPRYGDHLDLIIHVTVLCRILTYKETFAPLLQEWIEPWLQLLFLFNKFLHILLLMNISESHVFCGPSDQTVGKYLLAFELTGYHWLNGPYLIWRIIQITRTIPRWPFFKEINSLFWRTKEQVLGSVDPGFLVGGCWPLGERRPPMWALFGENVCQNERIGSRWGIQQWPCFVSSVSPGKTPVKLDTGMAGRNSLYRVLC